jgi:hypothetical protein
MRTGKARGRDLSPLMPWTVFRNLSDEDLNALFAYLRALPKVKTPHRQHRSTTRCRICGAEHPLGQYNKPQELKLIPVPLAELKDAPGYLSLRQRVDGSHRHRRGKADGEVRWRAPAANS